MALEILGKLDDFANVFDIEAYKKASLNYKVQTLANVDSEVFFRENVDLAAEFNFPMPTRKDCYVLGSNVVVVNDK